MLFQCRRDSISVHKCVVMAGRGVIIAEGVSGRKNKVTRRGYTLFLQSRFGFEQDEQVDLNAVLP